MNDVEQREVIASKQSNAVRGVQEGRYRTKGKITVSGKMENTRLYCAFCSASEA